MVQPHSNAVNSEIVYQCEESGFVPSSNSSLCREDRMWSPDPSQVECRMMTTTPEGTVVRKWSYQYIHIIQHLELVGPCLFHIVKHVAC